jgi:hypothetical protein
MGGSARAADDNAHASASVSSKAANDMYTTVRRLQQQKPESPAFATKPLPPSGQFFEAVLRNSTHNEEECIWLTKGVPKPSSGYTFSHQQIEQQIDFFKLKKRSSCSAFKFDRLL